MRLEQHHLEDLRGSGLSDEFIRLARFHSVSRQEATRILGFDPGCGGLAFPYVGTNGSGPQFIRFKPDKPFRDERGREAKYLSPKGARNRLYVPPHYTKKERLDKECPVILTEGEKKAAKAAQELPGFVGVALAGVWCFKDSSSSLINDFKLFAWKGRPVYICFDSDVVTKRPVRDAENALAAELDKLGADVFICRLPANPGEKVGLDDYLLRNSPEAFTRNVILRARVWSLRGHIAVEDAVEFMDKPITEQEEIIGCGLLPARSLLVASAYSKVGKSVLVSNLAICVAAGKPFLLQFPVPKRRRVLYFQMEISERSMQDRLQKMLRWAQQEGLNPGSFFKLVNLPPLKVDNDDGIKAAMRIIRACEPEVVIWDPLYKLHSQDENKSYAMQRVLDKFDYLRSVFGIAQIIVHHHGKPSKDSGKEGFQMMRGSSVFDAFADSYLTLTRWKKNKPSNYQKLEFTLRNAEEPAPLVLYRNPDTLWYEILADSDDQGKLSVANVVNALMHLSGQASRQELSEYLIRTHAVSQRTINETFKEGVELDRIRKIPEGKEMTYALHE